MKREIDRLKFLIKKYFKSKEMLINELLKLEIENKKLEDYEELYKHSIIERMKLNDNVKLLKSKNRELKLKNKEK